MSYFQGVRLYSLVEVCIFTSLIVTAVATVSPLGPIGSTIGLEYLARRRPAADAASRRAHP
jgi:hypothetical protein